MFYRRKIILSLLQLFDGSLDKISLQKLLFLFTRKQQKPVYDFIPYQYGCYSYSANADLTAMARKGILSETTKQFEKIDTTDYIKTLNETDKTIIQEIRTLYGDMPTNVLIKHTYINFPYWAINSKIAANILSAEQFDKISKSRPKGNTTILFTIGYEGISLEEYLNKLIKNNIKVLVDVRRNALSMKYGFSKSQLQHYCDNLGMLYLHIPEVGIQSDQRQELNTQDDYDNLFTTYCQTNLKGTITSQIKILDLLKKYKRIALTCFEANINQCHRKHLAEAITGLPEFKYELKHI